MRYKSVFWGILFIIAGILWLLQSLQIVDFGWHDVLALWPFILIWTGISVIPVKNIIRIILDILALCAALFVLLFPCNKPDNVRDIQITDKVAIETLDSLEYAYAELSMNAGAGTFIFAPGNALIEIKGLEMSERYLNIVESQEDNMRSAEITLNIHPFVDIIDNNQEKEMYVLLNPTPVWEMDLDMGASRSIMDMRDYKIQSLSIDAGVSDIALTLGDKYSDVEVEVSTGVTNLSMKVPLNMKCVIENKSALSGLNFKGFTQLSKQEYVSESQSDTVKGVIHITLESGVSNLSVERY